MNLFVMLQEILSLTYSSTYDTNIKMVYSKFINNDVVSLDNASFQMVRELAALDRIYAYIGYYLINAQQ